MKRLVVFALLLSGFASSAFASEILIADRLQNRVYRYSESGDFVGILVDDPVNLNQPNGMALSADLTKLYVASQANNRVVRYDYNGTTATNPFPITSGMNVPASILFNANGSLMYVSNLGGLFNGNTVGQFNPDGTSAGPALTGGAASGRTGLALSPGGELLVGTFQDGAVLKYNTATSAFENFIGPSPAISGVGNLLVNGNDLYLTAGQGRTVRKYNATTGAADPAFTPPSGLEFPASLVLAPDGNGILVGELSGANGGGRIIRYAFNGAFIEDFALNSTQDPGPGFHEATGMLVSPIPEPSTAALGTIALAALGWLARRRYTRA